ncbi:hemicentin-2-like [Zonotrichia albicollis]|uniref:hemicentin-2-like n=1 Tax=Zonotrichia albicollis TaxID=44394 RepID=UPI003D812514
MAQLSFILLIASLPILFPPVKPSDLSPPAPNISVTPAKARFLVGDAVSISCAAPAPPSTDRIQAFRFTGTSGWASDVRTSRRTSVHTFTVTGPRDGGFHTCSYSVVRRGGRVLHSPPSRAVFINIRDRPTQPNLTVTPSGLTVQGQPLLFLCMAPPSKAPRRHFRFLRDELEVSEGIVEGSGSARLRVERSSQNQTGNFSCSYEEMTEGRWIASYPSEAVAVVVEDPCPPPVLWVEPPSGVVTVGQRLRLTCSASRRHFRRRFRFFRDGIELTPGDLIDGVISDVTGDGSQLVFPRISPEFSGNFSCLLEEEVGGAWVEAPPSEGVAVVVMDLSPPAPNISVTPAKARFLVGDAVSISCAAPAPPGTDRIQAFRFNGTSGWASDVRTSRRTSVHTFTVTGPRDGGVHTCSYSVVRRGGRVLHSPPSRAVVIDVRDRPTQPNLTVTPSGLTVQGQPLLFLCMAPPSKAPRRHFRFLRDELEVSEGIVEGSGSARLRVERSSQNQTGNFSCSYEEMTEGRWIASYPSEAVAVVVEDPCPPPVLWVEPPSGVVTVGQRLRLTCSASRRHFRRRFRFFREGIELTPGDLIDGVISDVTGDGSQLVFPRISPEFSGNFSCLLEEEVGGAWVEAPPSEGVAVVVMDLSPPAPNISVTPAKARFLVGDAVSISCAAPAPPGTDRIQAFRFNGTSGWASDVRTSRRTSVHTFTVTGPRDGGVHTCSYSVVRRGGRVLHSPPSRAVVIDVRDRPTQPNLTVTPSGLTVQGQPLLFLCMAPPSKAPRRHFRFLRDELEVSEGIVEGSGSARLRVERSSQNQTGNFSCSYEEMTEGRWIASYPSEAVAVVVEDPCPPPVLWVEPPSGVVTVGQRLRLTCSASRRHFRRRFRFFRDGIELTPGDLIDGVISDVTGDGSQLVFPRISPEFSGNFSCLLEEEVGGAWVEAPPSEGVAVVVMDLSPPAPNISVTPAKARFLVGDAVSISCAAPAPPGTDRIQAFRFNGTSGWASDVRTSRRTSVHTFTVTGPRDGGVHTCSYSVVRRGGRVLHSPPSRAVVIDVRDRPTQPNLTVTPSGLTVQGQPLLFLCMAPPSKAPRRHFRFLRDELEVSEGIVEGSGSARLRVERSSQNQTGNFSCSYEEMTEGRWIASYPSEAVAVVVEDPCPPPVLWVEPPSGVVTVGQRLRLTCSASRRHFRRRFRFFRDGIELTPGDLIDGVISDVTGDGSQLVFPRISPEFSGNFSCLLEEEVGGAWVEAPPSEGVAVVVMDLSPPAANISVTPAKARFLVGDAVSISCAAPALPGTDRIQAFRFNGTSGWASDVRTSRRTSVHTFTVTGPRDGGVHTCSYSVVRRGGRVLHSPPSRAVVIDVRDRPTQPNLTVTPSGLTVQGQPLLFLCMAPPSKAPRRHFRFLRDELEVSEGIVEGSGSARLRVERSGQNQTGNFSCSYEEMTEGRWIASYPSEAVAVVVEDPCPPPVLWVEPPSGVVTVGQRLRLTCSASRRHFRRRFRFFRDGIELISGDLIDGVISDVTGDGSQLVFLRISPEFSGNFSCLLEEEVGGAWVEAPPSEGVAVVVMGGFSSPAEFEFPPLVIGGVVGVALTLLVILLAAWLGRRRRSQWGGEEDLDPKMSPDRLF